MHDPSAIAQFLDAVTRELSFDIPLSRRVRTEIEGHFLEAAASEPDGDSIDAQRQAIARFGDPREIARQYAASSLFAQMRRLGVIAILAFISILLAMKGRGAWYGLLQWRLSDHLKDAAANWIWIDVSAFKVAFFIGVVGAAYIASQRAPISFHQGYRRVVNRCAILSAAAAGTLLVSVAIDTVLTGLRLSEAELSASALIPAMLIGIEITVAAVLVLRICAVIRRTAFASSLLT